MAKNSKIPKTTATKTTVTNPSPTTPDDGSARPAGTELVTPIVSADDATPDTTTSSPKKSETKKENKKANEKVSSVPKAMDSEQEIEIMDASMSKMLNPQAAMAYIMTQADPIATFRRLVKNRQLSSVTQTTLLMQEADYEV